MLTNSNFIVKCYHYLSNGNIWHVFSYRERNASWARNDCTGGGKRHRSALKGRAIHQL